MSRRIRLSIAAGQDLRDIWRGFAEYSTLTVADEKVAVVQRKFALLSQFPESGRRREELMTGMRSLSAEEFVIFYCILDTDIQIVRIINGRRDIAGIFQEDDS
jgi:toxin ParE1/3/4